MNLTLYGLLHPKRAGGNSKAAAFRQVQARLKQDTPFSLIESGTMAYKAYCEATDKIGTEYIMMAATFFGRDEWFAEPWDLPIEKKKETYADVLKNQGDCIVTADWEDERVCCRNKAIRW